MDCNVLALGQQLTQLLHQSMRFVDALRRCHLNNVKGQQLQASLLQTASIVSYLEALHQAGIRR